MRVVSRQISHKSRTDKFKLTFIGDVHFGAVDCDVKRFRESVKAIASDENHYWIGVGDMGDYISPSDKRYDPAERDKDIDEDDLAYAQTRMVANELKPIRDTCLGIHCGNHEETIRIRYHANVHKRLCEMMVNKFGNPVADYADMSLGYCGITKLRFVREYKGGQASKLLKLCGHHGFGGGRKNGSSINRMEDLVLAFPGNHIYYKGHDHKRFGWVDTAIGVRDDKDEFYEFPMAFACTGSYKKAYEKNLIGYAEKGGMKPAPLGCVTFTIKPCGGEHEGFDIIAHNPTDGLPYIE